MIRRLFGMVKGLVVLGVLIYVLFFVQLGELTAFQHLMRIAKTDEAQELKREATDASKRIGEQVKEQIKKELPKRHRQPGDPADIPGLEDEPPSEPVPQ